jgi:hypothetical protein
MKKPATRKAQGKRQQNTRSGPPRLAACLPAAENNVPMKADQAPPPMPMPTPPTRQSAALNAMTAVWRAAAATKTTREFVSALDGPDVKPHQRAMEKALGVQGTTLATQLFAEAGMVFDHGYRNKSDSGQIVAAWQAALGMKPKGPMQCMLATQFLRTHSEAMLALNYSHGEGISVEASEIFLNRGMRLMRLALTQAETLARLQGKIAQQKIVVEKVLVNEGGRAIVGAVNQGGGTAGDEEQE